MQGQVVTKIAVGNAFLELIQHVVLPHDAPFDQGRSMTPLLRHLMPQLHSVKESQTLTKHSHKTPVSRETEPGCAGMLGSVTDLSFGERCAHSVRHKACV